MIPGWVEFLLGLLLGSGFGALLGGVAGIDLARREARQQALEHGAEPFRLRRPKPISLRNAHDRSLLRRGH